MFNININVLNNESISDKYRFIIIKNNKVIVDKFDYNLNALLNGGNYNLFIIYKSNIYKYSLLINKSFNYNIYICNKHKINIYLCDKYYENLPIEKGLISLANRDY